MLEDESVHPLVRKAAAWSWRLLVMFAALVVVLWLIKRLEVVTVPLALALILSALLLPGVDWLDRHGVQRGLAVFCCCSPGSPRSAEFWLSSSPSSSTVCRGWSIR